MEPSQNTTNLSPTNANPEPIPPPPLQAAPAVRPSKKRKLFYIALITVLGLFAIVVVMALVFVKNPVVLDVASSPALQVHSQNTARQVDVSQLATAVDKFLRDYGVYPKSTATDAAKAKTLEICGNDCTAANSTEVKLTYYSASPTAVSLRAYDKNLTVPDTKTVYIVPGAGCKADLSGIGNTTSSDALYFVVLYALQSGNSTKQQCLSLY